MGILSRFLLLSCAIFLLATNGYAIPASYGTATHTNTAWQELKTDGDQDEFGVSWSVDGGLNWGRDDLYVGQTVTFKFDLHKQNVGTHYADFLKTWIDWGQDGSFDEATDVAAFDMREILDLNGNPNGPNFSFFSDSFDILDSYVGDIWLRSRVACSESILNNWGAQWETETLTYYNRFNAIGHYYQGEVEEWKLTVNAAPVPEPATFLLIGFGLAGLVGVSRKKNK